MWDFLLHPSEPDLVLGRQLEVKPPAIGSSVPGPVLRGVMPSLQTEAIEASTGRGFNVTKARLHGSPLPAAGSLHPGFPAPVPARPNNPAPRRSSPSWVLTALSRGRPLVVLKSVIHDLLEVVAASGRSCTIVILSSESGTLLPGWGATSRFGLSHRLEGLRLAEDRRVRLACLRHLSAGRGR